MHGWSLADAVRAGLDCSWAKCDIDKGRPMMKRNAPELANLPMEGYFRALYALLGGSQIWSEKAALTSTKLCFSVFRDKSPCTSLCFGIADYTARGGRDFFFFLSLCSGSSFLDSTASANSSCFSFSSSSRSFCFCFPQVPILSVFAFSSNSIFSPDGLCNCLRLSFQPGWVT